MADVARTFTGIRVPAGPCPYGRPQEFLAAVLTPTPDAEAYRALLDRRCRRSGSAFYIPDCFDCADCVPLRVPVAGFRPSRSQRRCRQRNADLVLTVVPRGWDGERRDLYVRYQAGQHHDEVGPDADPAAFLVEDAGIPGGEVHARDAAGRLLGVAVFDQVGDAWSSVYCYWEVDQRRRSLGILLALAELDEAARRGLTWYYLGFHVAGWPAMAYKASFGPHELLRDGRWAPEPPAPEAAPG